MTSSRVGSAVSSGGSPPDEPAPASVASPSSVAESRQSEPIMRPSSRVGPAPGGPASHRTRRDRQLQDREPPPGGPQERGDLLGGGQLAVGEGPLHGLLLPQDVPRRGPVHGLQRAGDGVQTAVRSIEERGL